MDNIIGFAFIFILATFMLSFIDIFKKISNNLNDLVNHLTKRNLHKDNYLTKMELEKEKRH